MYDGQFDWGGRLPKRNGGARGKLRTVGNRPLECKGISLPDCDSDS